MYNTDPGGAGGTAADRNQGTSSVNIYTGSVLTIVVGTKGIGGVDPNGGTVGGNGATGRVSITVGGSTYTYTNRNIYGKLIMSDFTPEQLEAMMDRAAKKGARQALRDLGLSDLDAANDIKELRSLLDSWRDTKKSIWKTLVQLGTVAVLTFIATAVWMQVGK